VPTFNAHPLNFPFSDGILVADVSTTLIRIVVLLIVTLIAGYIPARMIINKNTLDSILGR
jgi:ABC-type antimicrobial peptide transport system permease subunit